MTGSPGQPQRAHQTEGDRGAVSPTKITPTKILILDDLEEMRWLLSNLVRLAGCQPIAAATAAEGLASLRQELPDAVLLDVCMPDMDGFAVLRQIQKLDRAIPVIMVTAHGGTPDAVRAIRAGAYDYVTRPFRNEDLLLTLRSAIDDMALQGSARRISDGQRHARPLLELMGGGNAVRRIVTQVERVGPTNLPVLITGDTGTGKELVAQAIHAASLRADKPFIVVDCGAIPDTLIESELFGHEKGAFTGAHRPRAGALELASGGTLFLDEIGNLPLLTQTSLLRALETQCVRRVGSTQEQRLDFRIIAATNVDLRASVVQQAFRSDLYHRLAGFTVRLTPLCERRESIPYLVQRFIVEANRELGRHVVGLSEIAQALVQRYDWPGNVRELRNQIRRAVLLCDGPGALIAPENLGIADIGQRSADAAPPEASPGCCARPGGTQECLFRVPRDLLSGHRSLTDMVQSTMAEFEYWVMLQALSQTHGNKTQASRLLGIDNKTLRSKLNKHRDSSMTINRTHPPQVGVDS